MSDRSGGDAADAVTVPQMPRIVFSTGVGLAICSLADAFSRGTVVPAMGIYWIGIVVIAVPILFRLTSRDASGNERLLLACLLGLALYAVKVLRDSPTFTFIDELIHAYNAEQIADHKHLFRDNSILEVTPFYPGLEGAASALVRLTGLSIYTSAMILIAAARVTLIAALFFLFRRISGSARTAGLGAAIYASNFNFFFYSAQFSYESLALPLLVLVLMLLAEREAAPREAMRDWVLPIGLGIAAIVVTHHLTSYALVAVLLALSLAYRLANRSWRPPNPWPYGAYAALLALGWLLVVASSTFGYLEPPLSGALEAIGETVAGEQPRRALFQGGASYVGSTPTEARAVALLAVALLALALPFGLGRIWQRLRSQPFALIFAVAAMGFFATLALRLAPAAWETGNRASEFLFIGLAFVIAVAVAELRSWRPRSSALLGRLAVTAGLTVVLVGGAISGWPWDTQLAQPLRVRANGGDIVSQPLSMAEWARDQVPGGRFAAPTADGSMLLYPGGKTALIGPDPDIEDILIEPFLASWQLPLLRQNNLRYVVVDRRTISADGIRGFYFRQDDSSPADSLLPLGVVTKFERIPSASRIYTNGAITVFDLEGKP